MAAALARGRGRAHTLASAFAAYTGHNRYHRTRLRHPTATLAARRLGRGDLLSVPELAALAHLPVDAFVPGLQRAGARALAPPPGIPTPGPGVKPLGVTDTQPARPVGVRVADARHHLHVVGATGSGKSTLLAQLILDDAHAGRGVVLIDPKGDLVTDLTRPPPPPAARTGSVLLDPDSRARPPCLNPSTHPPIPTPPRTTTRSAAGSGRRRRWGRRWRWRTWCRCSGASTPRYWGPRTDDLMRAACLTLPPTPGVATLADIPKLLTDPALPRPRHCRGHRPGAARVLGLVRGPVRTRQSPAVAPAAEQAARVAAAPLRPRRPRRRTPPTSTSPPSSTTAGSCWSASPKAASAKTPPASSAPSSSPAPGRPPPPAPANPNPNAPTPRW